ncbi:MAG: 6,7-dimethyl-8-ribityllumazine synthase [Dehalococcoidia bacterium]
MTKGGISFEGGLDASGLQIAIVTARFNPHVTSLLYDGCRDELEGRGLRPDRLRSVEVPGCFELAVTAQTLAASGRFDAVVCLGAIIRGETPHFEFVASATASGLQQAALATGIPVVFGVLTTETEQQALDRAGGSAGHKGREAALTAIEMAHRMRDLREGRGADDQT